MKCLLHSGEARNTGKFVITKFQTLTLITDILVQNLWTRIGFRTFWFKIFGLGLDSGHFGSKSLDSDWIPNILVQNLWTRTGFRIFQFEIKKIRIK
jgi:hypothetical protein